MAIDTLNTPAESGTLSQAMNLTKGGQNGIMPAHHEYNSSAGYVPEPLIAVLVTAPRAVKYLPDPERYVATLKELTEVTAKRIEGLNSTITNEFSEIRVGNAGEVLEQATGSQRARSTPSFTWDERFGQAIVRFWTEHSRLFVMDPDLGKPGIIAESKYIEAGSPPLLPEDLTYSVMYLEPDATLTQVVKAWLCANHQPKSGGELVGRRELGVAKAIPEVTIEFTALTAIGNAVNVMAKAYLKSLRLEDLRPMDMKLFNENLDKDDKGIAPDVAAAKDGYASKISDVVKSV